MPPGKPGPIPAVRVADYLPGTRLFANFNPAAGSAQYTSRSRPTTNFPEYREAISSFQLVRLLGTG